MKIARFTYQGALHLGDVVGDYVYPFAGAADLLPVIRSGQLPARSETQLALADVQLTAPLFPGKVIAVGRNYAEHAAELGNALPEKPLLFAKLPSSITAPDSLIAWRTAQSQQVDWECELAVVIGRRARNVPESAALEVIFGYTVANDVSARDLQKAEPQWLRAKSLDTFCPLGPWVVTRDEIADPQALALRTVVNDTVMQNSSTAHMIFKVATLIAYCSQQFTLEPGDLLLTGTPAGVGSGMQPPRYLQDGDVVTVSVEGIGALRNTCRVLTD